jgi:hypothetical protein
VELKGFLNGRCHIRDIEVSQKLEDQNILAFAGRATSGLKITAEPFKTAG